MASFQTRQGNTGAADTVFQKEEDPVTVKVPKQGVFMLMPAAVFPLFTKFGV